VVLKNHGSGPDGKKYKLRRAAASSEPWRDEGGVTRRWKENLKTVGSWSQARIRCCQEEE
jgi:hypothetical protein